MLYKGAPPFSMSALYIIMNFNPRAPCGARQRGWSLYFVIVCFNPRAPCGARQLQDIRNIRINEFQSTRPVWGATWAYGLCPVPSWRFNPRAPCGARRQISVCIVPDRPFQSTRPMRGATGTEQCGCPPEAVSIHAPHAGRDAHRGVLRSSRGGFNPRAPCGARPSSGV